MFNKFATRGKQFTRFLAKKRQFTSSSSAKQFAFAKTAAVLTAAATSAYLVNQYYLNQQAEEENNEKLVYNKEMVLAAEKRDLTAVQSSVFSDMHPHCAIVTIKLSPQANRYEVLNACSRFEGLIESLLKQQDESAPQDDSDALPSILAGLGFSTNLWESWSGADARIKSQKVSKHYETRNGMPATGGDIILHVKASSQSKCYETVEAFLRVLPRKSITSVQDYYGFKYKDGRDLSGFLDGTVNPSGEEDRYDAAVLPNGGSYLLHQVWHHQMDALEKYPVQDQEKFVGRTKPVSAELKELPATSHVARTRDAQGNIIPIVRQSMPFGRVGENRGLLFIAYSNSLDKFDTMLDRMSGAADGNQDAIFKFTKCVSGNYYYIPSKLELKNLKK